MKCLKTNNLFILICLFISSLTILNAKDFNPIGQIFKDYIKDIKFIKNKLYEIPNIDSVLKDEDYKDSLSISRPYKFGIKIKEGNVTKENFTKDTLDDKFILLRYKIVSQKASSININFEDFYLPDECQIFTYNSDYSSIDGPWANFNTKSLNSFATFPVLSDTCIIEISLPIIQYDSLKFTISDIIYGFRKSLIFDEINHSQNSLGLGSSSDCNIDANCSDGDEWCKQKNSVVMIQMGGTDNCSGALVNNTNLNYKGYILTAFHCFDYTDPPNELNNWEKNNIQNYSYKFFYYSTQCSSGVANPNSIVYSGATYRAGSYNSDFALIELNNFEVTNNNSNNSYFKDLYFSGWEMYPSITPITQVTSLHHPKADLLKFSQTGSLPDSIGVCNRWGDHAGNHPKNYLRIRYSKGIIQNNSSGHPMYNQNKHIVAQLYGGTELLAICNDPNDFAWGGLFYKSWLGDGTKETSLNEWLDPNNLIDDRYITDLSNATGLHNLDGSYMPQYYYGHIYNSGTNTLKKAHTNMRVGSSSSNTFVVKSGATLTLKAGKEIRIRPCTRIQEGSNFRAYIQELDCSETVGAGEKESDYSNNCTTSYPKLSTDTQPIIQHNTNFTLSPNPADETIRVSYQITGSGKLYLRSSLGVDLIPSISLENAKGIENIDISKFPVGIYLITIESDSGIHTDKFVISR